MARPMRHKWGGRKVNPLFAGVLLGEAAIHRLLIPLHTAATLLPMGLFTREHADKVALIVNLVSVDAAERGSEMWKTANRVGDILVCMRTRADSGKAWNCTADERAALIEGVRAMDRYMRTWTNRRFTLAAMTVDRINAKAVARGGKFLDRVDLEGEEAK